MRDRVMRVRQLADRLAAPASAEVRRQVTAGAAPVAKASPWPPAPRPGMELVKVTTDPATGKRSAHYRAVAP